MMSPETTNRNLTYDLMIHNLLQLLVTLRTLNFANSFFYEHLNNSEKKGELKKTAYVISTTLERANEDGLRLMTGENILENIEMLMSQYNCDFKTATDNIITGNAQFIRTKTLISSFEIVLNYLNTLKKPEARRKIFNEEWFKLLEVLRDCAAHFDNIGKPVVWKHREDKLSFGDLTIKKGDMGHALRYNSFHVEDLLLKLMDFLTSNRSDFE